MNPHLAAALAAERQLDFERAAGCCTPAAEHRRTLHRGLRDRIADRVALRGAVKSGACCPAA